MTEQEWLTSESPAEMLEYVRPIATDEQLRGFVEACREDCRAGPMSLQNEIDNWGYAAESWCSSDVSIHWTLPAEVRCHFIRDIFGNPFRPICILCKDQRRRKWYRGEPSQGHDWEPCECVEEIESWRTENVMQLVAGMLRPVECDICDGFGEFRECYPELGGESLVEQCGKCHGTGKTYDFSAMPILADALEDAACTNEEILNHCRRLERCEVCFVLNSVELMLGVEPDGNDSDCNFCQGAGWMSMRGQHTPGCWVLRLLAKKCRCCHSAIAIIGDKYDRCKDCQDMVPTRRGGFRQLGTYDG